MKSILISIKPEWVAKILNGEKTIEIRKTAPKCELPIDVYIYCTKDSKRAWYFDKQWRGCYSMSIYDDNAAYEYAMGLKPLNGKVVAKFKLRFVDKIYSYDTDKLDTELGSSLEELSFESCVPEKDLLSYVGNGAFYWAISNLEIFDEPKELDEFDYLNPSGTRYVSKRSINGLPSKKHPPQSWCYVEDKA